MKNPGRCQTQRLKSRASLMIKVIRSASFFKKIVDHPINKGRQPARLVPDNQNEIIFNN